jgi:hypothetical protein
MITDKFGGSTVDYAIYLVANKVRKSVESLFNSEILNILKNCILEVNWEFKNIDILWK